MQQAGRRILVVGPSWVGDMMMAQSLFMWLKQQWPQCMVDVVAPVWSLPLLQRMPEVHQGIALAVGHGELDLSARWRLGRMLAQQGYDQAIVLPGSFKSALLPLFAGIRQRTGFRGEMRYGLLNDMRTLDRQTLPLTVQRFVCLGLPVDGDALPQPLPQPHLTADIVNQERLYATLQLSEERPAIAFMPGAEYGPAKQWPLASFAALAQQLEAAGYQVWILGSAKDSVAAQEIQARSGGSRVYDVCGKTALSDAVDLLALCEASVTNDSGLMHVAAALGKPLVAIFGSSTPDHTPPLTTEAQICYLHLECSPCFERVCPLGHTRCLTEITPQQVWQRLQQLLPGLGAWV